MMKKIRLFVIVFLLCATAACMGISGIAFAAKVDGNVSSIVDIADDSNFEVATATAEQFTGTYFVSAPEAPVARRVCDANKAIVLKLDFTGKSTESVGIGAILGISSDLAVSVNTNSHDPADEGWRNIIITENGALSGDAIIGSQASGLSDKSILYYYISLGEYFDGGNILYVLFGDKNTADGNGTCIYDHIDIYEELVYMDGSITVGESATVAAKLDDDDTFYKITAGVGFHTGNEMLGGKYKWRHVDKADYVMYKVVFEVDSPNAVMNVITKRSSNMCIRISTDENSPLDDWDIICSANKKRLGAAIVEPCDVTNDGDASFSMYVFRIGEYAMARQPVYVSFGAEDTTAGNGIQFADRVEFCANREIVDPMVDLNVNRVVIDVSDASLIFDNSASNVTSNSLGTGRFADVTNYFTYKIVMPADKKTEIYMKVMMLGINRAISFSPDDINYTQIATAPDISGIWGSDLALGDTFYYKLDNYIGTEKIGGTDVSVVYVKFHATDTSTGNGACVYSLEFINGSINPVSASANSSLGEKAFACEIDVLDNSLIVDSANSSTSSYYGQPGRMATGDTAYFVYKVELPESAKKFSVSFNRINSLLFRVSQDGTNFQNVSEMPMSTDGDGASTCVDLSSLISGGKTFWLRFQGTRDQNSMLLSLYLMYSSDRLNANAYTEESYQSFTTGDASELEYWQNETSLNVRFVGNYREFNQTATGVYRFNYKEGAKAVHLFGEVGGTYVLSVSADGENWIDLASSGVQYYDTTLYPWYRTMKDFRWDISSYVVTAENTSRNVYVRIADAVSDNSSGATLRGLGIVSCDGEEVIPSSGDNGNDATIEPETKKGCKSSLNTGLIASLACLVTACVVKRKII